MPIGRERRSHVLAPSRKIPRRSIADVIRRELSLPGDDHPFDFFDLPAQGRRAVLDALRNRSLAP